MVDVSILHPKLKNKFIYTVQMKSYLVFSLFTIVRFQNDMCLTASGGNGTCKFKRICSTYIIKVF